MCDDRATGYVLLTVEDPFWWCAPCEEGDHDDHVPVYLDAFGAEACCECPSCEA